MDEFTVIKMIKESKQELNVLKNKHMAAPTKQTKFDLDLKSVGIALLNVKLKNIRRRGTYS
jgi:hypothetical protein